ncbi:MAG: tRNA uridine 5-carboxymethylaminomethyl modification enzyme, partial [Bacteroidota bacterium]|nr:tRNA uridine 5-carboxymethylaminomethyl modification enzyme [Bacteroidota bacterium]
MNNRFEILVIGGGHAGIEAAYSAAKMGCRTALLSMSLRTMGKPSCNPSIGGTAKGHLVKEIDALGGAMGLLADRGGIQFKMLNKSKGPAVWSPRSQIDKDLYPLYVLSFLSKVKNLTLIEDSIYEILIKNDKVIGAICGKNELLYAEKIILCAGTFLNGKMYTGVHTTIGGRVGEPAAAGLSEKLRGFGFEIGRLKTG